VSAHLRCYADAGGNIVDTASNYRDGASEEIVGELLAGRRDRFVVATKYTVTRDPADPNGGGNHRKNLRLSLENSLRRLRTDHVDVYWVHVHGLYTAWVGGGGRSCSARLTTRWFKAGVDRSQSLRPRTRIRCGQH
jgi:aryl-alcohol dehydrogenase-like predicted oxidoreductase